MRLPMSSTVPSTVGASARNLILANIITLIAALVFQWEVAWLLWPYWIQSVIIGIYARKRMLDLAQFSTDGFTSNDQPVPENEQGKRSTANFFVLHYGGFHLGYLVFLLAEHRVSGLWNMSILLACGVSFVLSQRTTYAVQHAADLRGKPNLGSDVHALCAHPADASRDHFRQWTGRRRLHAGVVHRAENAVGHRPGSLGPQGRRENRIACGPHARAAMTPGRRHENAGTRPAFRETSRWLQQVQPFNCPSAARPLSRARANTVSCALPTLPTRSCDQIFSAADCIARP